MPNWCFNSVTVRGKTKAELEQFVDFATRKHTSRHINPFDDTQKNEEVGGVFWNFITPPDEILDEYFGKQPQYEDSLPLSDPKWAEQVAERSKVSNHWYDWNIRNWGSKWDVELRREELEEFDKNDDGYWYFNWNFETPWSPAIPAYHAIAKLFPNLEFEYEITEEFNHYAGVILFAYGELKSEQFFEYPTKQHYEELGIPAPDWSEDEESESNDD